MNDTPMGEGGASRRNFVKKAIYVAPAVVTLAVAPAYAIVGSAPLSASRAASGSMADPRRARGD